ncbi:MAG: hypothetical protein MJA29_05735 [Candidatus Omnitrophica bacterium]|nr:hypothetical protein [Candidatus Omnitrophota bacterium]
MSWVLKVVVGSGYHSAKKAPLALKKVVNLTMNLSKMAIFTENVVEESHHM